jgi:hypothetical protein
MNELAKSKYSFVLESCTADISPYWALPEAKDAVDQGVFSPPPFALFIFTAVLLLERNL